MTELILRNMEEIYLNDSWSVFFHDPYENDWTNVSYNKIGVIGTVNDFCKHLHNMKGNVTKGMWFMMRDDIFPCWDDPENINGGALSIKILKEHVDEFWQNLMEKVLGESVLIPSIRDEKWNCINGISSSPKKHFCIIKIWLKDDSLFEKDEYFDLLKTYHGNIIYKLNMESIQHDKI